MKHIDLNAMKQIYKEKTGKDFNFDKQDAKQYLSDLNAKQAAKDNARMLKIKQARFYDNSVWSGLGQPIHFTFSEWNVAKQKNQAQAREVARKAHDLINTKKVDFNIILLGSPGTGKTSLAVAMMNALKNRGYTVMFVATDELARMIDEMYDGGLFVRKNVNLLIKAMKQVDVLVLDDFGTEGGMKGAFKPVRSDMQSRLYDVANARFGIKMTIITTNNSLKELGIMYNPKLLSRLISGNSDHFIDFNSLDDVRGNMI